MFIRKKFTYCYWNKQPKANEIYYRNIFSDRQIISTVLGNGSEFKNDYIHYLIADHPLDI